MTPEQLQQFNEMRDKLSAIDTDTLNRAGQLKLPLDLTTEALLKGLVSQAFPVGGIFISVVSTNPASLLGYGTWIAFGTGRTLVGFDSGQAEFDTVEETGGAKTHTLTIAEMPAHTHDTGYTDNRAAPSSGSSVPQNSASTTITGSTGGDGAHNNLQPYVVVFMWKRIS